jgi:uncharacterized protein YqgV (UPF0045/DUF77 family)
MIRSNKKRYNQRILNPTHSTMPKKVNAALQVIPLNTPDSYAIVDQAIAEIQASGLPCQVGPFSTSVEGELTAILSLVEKLRDVCFDQGTEELLLNVQIHLKKDADVTTQEKVAKFQ